MVDKMCAHYGLELVETGVGFKYICAEMLKGNVLLGFEESGGIGFPGTDARTRRHRRRHDAAGDCSPPSASLSINFCAGWKGSLARIITRGWTPISRWKNAPR